MAGEKEARVRLPVAGLVIISLVYILYAWDRLVVPIELVELRKAFGLNLAAAGFLSTIFTFGIALTAIPAGFFVIRFGTRTSLVVAAVIFLGLSLNLLKQVTPYPMDGEETARSCSNLGL